MKNFCPCKNKHVSLRPRYVSLQIPFDWQVKKLADIADKIENGLTYDAKIRTHGIPITRIETISNEEINDEKVGYLEKIDSGAEKRYRLRYGDILFSHINSLEHVGKSAIYKDYPKILIHGMNLIRIVSKDSEADQFYLLYYLRYQQTRNRFRAISNPAVNQVSINTTQLKKFEVILPKLKEQQKIASILSNVDKLIQKTDQIIEQIQRFKEGLMQRLLTKGIGHTNFVKASLPIKSHKNQIPIDWKIVKLSELSKVVRGSSPRPAGDSKYFGGEIPWITVSELTKDENIYLKKVGNGLTREGLHYSRYLEKDTVVLVNSGATLGIPKILKLSGCINDGIAAFLNLNDRIIPEFLYYLLFFWIKIIRTLNQGVYQVNINTEIIGNLEVPLPSIAEQKKITTILLEVNRNMQIKKDCKIKLDNLKKGLMQQLLTGKIRVKV